MSYRYFASIFASVLLFAGYVGSVIGQEKRPLDDAFYYGKLRLSYSLFGNGAGGSAELGRIYNAGRWVDLVKGVVAQKFDVDVYYFYLGRAAEELDAPEAALIYYDLAINLPSKCVASNTCAKISLPGAAVARRSGLLGPANGVIAQWKVGEGPLLREIIKANPQTIQALVESPAQAGRGRGKFETDEEYRTRVASGADLQFVIVRVPTNDGERCKVKYNHELGIYSVNGCLVFSESSPLLKNTEYGSPITLSNAFDRREIRRLLLNEYYLAANFSWSTELKLPRVNAESLDSDLFAGVLFDGYTSSKSCSLCRTRELADGIDNIAESLAAIKGKSSGSSSNGWKDQAFKSGEVTEDWIYSIKPTAIKRFVVFRKSDSRLLYDLQPE